MPPEISTLMRYAPALILNRLVKDPRPLSEPALESFPAAVMFADISGFTALTEKLTRDNPRGVEELAGILDIYIGKLVEIITEHGGDVVKFAGDALFAVWRAQDEKSLPLETHRATHCGVVIQEQLHNLKVTSGVSLSLRVGLGAGQMHALMIGGAFERWELLIAGEPMNQVGRAGKISMPGEVVISPTAWRYIQKIGGGRPMNNRRFRLVSPEGGAHPLESLEPPRDAEKALRAYIPRAILDRLDEGKDGWSAELREVTVLFLNVRNFRYTPATPLAAVQRIMKVMQDTIYAHEGSINRFGIDDKGAILLAAFGLPPLDHVDDAPRAVRAALDLHKELEKLDQKCVIGIATGQVFCGSVGNSIRCEYTMHGNNVNLAARLMQNAETVLCNEETYLAAKDELKFEEQPRIKVKGREEPVSVFMPRSIIK